MAFDNGKAINSRHIARGDDNAAALKKIYLHKTSHNTLFNSDLFLCIFYDSL